VGAEWADWAEWVPQLANPLLAIHYAKAATVVRINSKRDRDQHKQVKCKNRVTSFWSGQNYGHLVIVQSYAAETTAMTTVSGGCYMIPGPLLSGQLSSAKGRNVSYSHFPCCRPQKPQQAQRKTRLLLLLVASIENVIRVVSCHFVLTCVLQFL